MATITLDVPDAQLPRVIDALCASGGYPAGTDLTRPQFAKRELARLVRAHVRQYEATLAGATVADIDIT